MRSNDIKLRITAFMAAAVMAAGLAGCGSSEKKGGSDSKSGVGEPAESVIDGKKVEVFLAEDGTPYYVNEDGEKMMLFATPFADENDDSTDVDDGDESFDTTQNYIRGEYSSNGLEFTIPDGWFAEDSLGAPTLFKDMGDGAELNYDEVISIVPTNYVFTTFENGEADEESIKSYFKDLSDAGFYTQFELLGSGTLPVCGLDAKYFDLKATMPKEGGDGEEVFRTRYIITPGDNSHCFILASLDTDESAEYVQSIFDTFAATMKLPTAEQMNNTDAYLEDDAAGLDAEIEPQG